MGIWDSMEKSGAAAEDLAFNSSGNVWGQKPNPGTPTGAPAVTVSQPAAKSSPAKVSRDDYWANKELRDLEKERVYREEDIPAIRRSTAYSTAATLAAAALAGDALSFGSAAKGKRLDMYLGYVDLIAAHVLAKLNGEDMLDLTAEADEATEDAQPPAQEETNLG